MQIFSCMGWRVLAFLTLLLFKGLLYFQSFLCIYKNRCYADGEYTHIITDWSETVNIHVHKSFLNWLNIVLWKTTNSEIDLGNLEVVIYQIEDSLATVLF